MQLPQTTVPSLEVHVSERTTQSVPRGAPAKTPTWMPKTTDTNKLYTDHIAIFTHPYHWARKKDKFRTLKGKGTHLENITLSEINQTCNLK